MSWKRYQTAGPVTALYVAPPLTDASETLPVIYAGIGPDVVAYDLCSGKFLARLESLPTGVVHGLRESLQVSSDTTSWRYVVAFGQKQLALIKSCHEYEPNLQPDAALKNNDANKNTLAGATAKVVRHHRVKLQSSRHVTFEDMVCDVKLLPGDVHSPRTQSFSAAVGFAHNFVQVWSLCATAAGDEPTCTHQLQCDVRCLLYSMSFFGSGVSNLVVASGTIFNEIVIWDPFGGSPRSAVPAVLQS